MSVGMYISIILAVVGMQVLIVYHVSLLAPGCFGVSPTSSLEWYGYHCCAKVHIYIYILSHTSFVRTSMLENKIRLNLSVKELREDVDKTMSGRSFTVVKKSESDIKVEVYYHRPCLSG